MVETQPGSPLLKVQDVYAGYNGLDILNGVNLEVNPGEVVCVIGPNGAGKSTVFKAIYGFIRVRQGKIWLIDREVTNYRPQDMLQAGVTIVPQWRSNFPQMTVYENLDLGMYLEHDRRRIKQRIDHVFHLFPILAQRSIQKAETLSGGEQRMLEIGRALMWEPRMMLLDEPSAGLAPGIARNVTHSLLQLNKETGLALLMIEQNARHGLEISHRGYVLELGRNVYQGTGQELIDNQEVRRLFLGGENNNHRNSSPPRAGQ